MKIELEGSGGSKIISGYNFRNIIGAAKIKSTLFEFGTRSPYINEDRGSLPLSTVSKKNEISDPDVDLTEKIDLSQMPEDKEDKLVWLTKKRVFTTLELMEILSKPDDHDLYIQKGIDRAEGTSPNARSGI